MGYFDELSNLEGLYNKYFGKRLCTKKKWNADLHLYPHVRVTQLDPTYSSPQDLA